LESLCDMRLCDELRKYGDSEFYPFHMPGHKRNPKFLKDLYDSRGNLVDITEIKGFDNLHNATGIIEEEQKRAARIFGADRSFILVNGSSCGILAAIAAEVPFGGKALVARNCHKSVFNGLKLREASLVYLTPEQRVYPEYNLQLTGQVFAKDIEVALEENPDIKLVIITSPTYEGICSDIKSIAKVCHRVKVPLMVDAAHGAHFDFHKDFPESAVKQGADIVINSLHKTLPALTSTALMHVSGDLVDITGVEYYLQVFQTSSPSYILMSSVSSCLKYLESEEAKEDFENYVNRLRSFYNRADHILPADDRDISKIIIAPPKNVNGIDYSDYLRKTHHLEMELANATYVLAMTSVCDEEEGFLRLKDALSTSYKSDENIENNNKEQKSLDTFWLGKKCPVALVPYPPGIPLVQKDEIITEDHLFFIESLIKEGIQIEGLNHISQIVN